jgi:putative membrane protein
MSESVYLGFKSLHIIAVISWMAGLLYLPRLFVYHAENKEENLIHLLLSLMERRLYRYIMSPALVVSWVTGLSMMIVADWVTSGWMHSKLFLVLLMTGFHFYLGYAHQALVSGLSEKSSKYFRIINEVPTLLMIGIVILVVYKAF